VLGQTFLVKNVVYRHVNEPEVVEAVGRLMATVASIIVHSYEKVQLLSFEETTGISQALIKTDIRAGVEKLLED